MAIHYNAFISYRHSPLDSKIAQRIHRQLEHFKIPRAIQKATNIKKIDRIFRDKEELPLSINLSDDINEALANSDYLIVICSPRTRESLWVQQEIRTFLELHSRERILIVLAEGEPNDVVPPILLEGQEPLCCDFRMKAGQATHMELPRLAAALIGCRYDDLVQRQKQYRNRRLAAVLSGLVIASTAFGLYAFSTSQRIQANLTRALISQSQYLAGESKELLNRGDRMSAILLALEALPSQDEARPWLPEAELALAEAVGVYQSEPQSQNVNIYQHKGQILDFLEAYGGRQLISWDDTNLIYVWDAETYELITSFTPECSTDSLQGLVLSENRLLLLHSFSYDLYCYNFLSGELLWSYKDDFVHTITRNEHSNELAFFTNTGLYLTNAEDLSVQFSDETITEQLGGNAYPDHLVCSRDGEWIAFDYRSPVGGTSVPHVAIYSVKDRQISSTLYYESDTDILTMEFLDDCLLLVTGAEQQSGSGTHSSDTLVTQLNSYQILCLSPKRTEILWENQLETAMQPYGYFLDQGTLTLEDGSQSTAAICTVGDVCQVYDLNTGELFNRFRLPSAAICTGIGTHIRSDTTDHDVLYAITQTGHFCSAGLTDPAMTATRNYTDNLQFGKLSLADYVVASDSTQIQVYSDLITDENYQRLTNQPETGMDWYDFQGVQGRCLFLRVNDAMFRCYDRLDNRMLWQSEAHDRNPFLNLLGLTEDEQYLLATDIYATEGSMILYKYNMSDGSIASIQTLEVPSYLMAFTGNELLCFDSEYDNAARQQLHQMYRIDLNGTLLETARLEGLDPAWPIRNIYPDHAKNRFLLHLDNHAVYLADPDEAACLQINELLLETDPITQLQVAWASDDTQIALIGTQYIQTYSVADGKQTLIPCEGLVDCVNFVPDTKELLVLYANGNLYRYDTDGTILGSTSLESELLDCFSLNKSSNTRRWQFTDFGLVLQVGNLCILIDTETWMPYSWVPHAELYSQETDSFIISYPDTDNRIHLAAYDRYSHQALLEKARQALGNNQLTEEQKEKYGLN